MGMGIVSAGAKAEAGGVFLDVFTPKTVIQGTWNLASIAGLLYGGHIYNNSDAVNDEINFPIYLSAGDYDIQMIFREGTLYGISNVILDTTVILVTDHYDAGGTVENIIGTATSFTVTESGVKTLKIKCTGKNPASSNYLFYVQSIVIRRTA